MTDEIATPTYEQLEQENVRLRARIVELEGIDLMRQAEAAGMRKRATLRTQLDPEARDLFQRPAYRRK